MLSTGPQQKRHPPSHFLLLRKAPFLSLITAVPLFSGPGLAARLIRPSKPSSACPTATRPQRLPLSISLHVDHIDVDGLRHHDFNSSPTSFPLPPFPPPAFPPMARRLGIYLLPNCPSFFFFAITALSDYALYTYAISLTGDHISWAFLSDFPKNPF